MNPVICRITIDLPLEDSDPADIVGTIISEVYYAMGDPKFLTVSVETLSAPGSANAVNPNPKTKVKKSAKS